MSSSWPPNFTLSLAHTFSKDFPNLKPQDCEPEISDATTSYNCIAWAASDISAWWWPDDPVIGSGYWPNGVPREETIEAFIEAYRTLGYELCDDSSLEIEFEKIAIYALGRVPTHAARQLRNGLWTSKLGEFEDIDHRTLDCLHGPLYGQVVTYLRRRLTVI